MKRHDHGVKVRHCFGCHKEFKDSDSKINLRARNAYVTIHNNIKCETLVRENNPAMRYAALANY